MPEKGRAKAAAPAASVPARTAGKRSKASLPPKLLRAETPLPKLPMKLLMTFPVTFPMTFPVTRSRVAKVQNAAAVRAAVEDAAALRKGRLPGKVPARLRAKAANSAPRAFRPM